MMKRFHLIFASALLAGSLSTWLLAYALGLVFRWRQETWLAALLLVPVYIASRWFSESKRKKAIVALTEKRRKTDAPLLTETNRFGVALRDILMVTGLILFGLAMAGPRYGTHSVALRKRGIDLVIALDMSKSMLAKDVTPSRYERAKLEISDFVSNLGGDRVGLIAFAGSTISYPMTDDYAATRLFLRDLNPRDMPYGGTAIGKALDAAKKVLLRGKTKTRSEADQVVVLFTDGEDHVGDPIKAANDLKEAGIRLFSVGIGTEAGEPIPAYATDGTWTGYMRDSDGKIITSALSKENEATLRQMAESAGGEYFAAGRGDVGVQKIAARISRMKKRQRQTRTVTVHEDRVELLLTPAILVFALAWIVPTSLPRRRRERISDA